MSNFLINASGLKAGGGLQVADSVCCELNNFPEHRFVVVLSHYLQETAKRITEYNNVEVVFYDLPNRNLWLLLTGRDNFLDSLVTEKKIKAVLSFFGPNLWVPKCAHLSGFARAHLVMPESPYYREMPFFKRMKEFGMNKILKYYFRKSSKVFYTESPAITERLKNLIPGITVHTVTNNYNQVFDEPEKWTKRELPTFDGKSFLCISSPYPHKNLAIALDIANIWVDEKPDFRFRFVFTISRSDYPEIPRNLESHFLLIGKCDVSECPSLYEQCDVAFQPSLLECFTATYPESMRMGKPIVTTDLEFAKGICGDAACYYGAIDPREASDALFKVATDTEYAAQLVANGRKQLLVFDDYKQRAKKLVNILEEISCKQ